MLEKEYLVEMEILKKIATGEIIAMKTQIWKKHFQENK